MKDLAEVVATHIVDVPDFPIVGVTFKDITPLLQAPDAFRAVIDGIADAYRGSVDTVAGIESRGFLFGAALAYSLEVPLVLVRKAGKLPRETHGVSYDLEYGSATIEIHQDAIVEGARVLLIDDVLATGGTAAAAASLVEQAGGSVADIVVILELSFLGGRRLLADRGVTPLLTV